ncbi:MAG: DEAD/DEAH box helicase [Planctomycetes bacterium]|nr:DEAD/DEAH box helicase [Planctomycetota bacterium]
MTDTRLPETLHAWQRLAPDRPAFVTFWATGPDTAVDGVFRVSALRPAADGNGWESFDRFARPFEDSEDATATKRMLREYGVGSAELEGADDARTAWSALREFLGERPLVVPDAEAFDAWNGRYARGSAALAERIGLCDLAALLLPGRLASLREGLIDALTDGADRPSSLAVSPADLQAATAGLLERFAKLGADAHALAAVGYTAAHARLTVVDEPAAARLALALRLVDRPSGWTASADGGLFHGTELEDGWLSASRTEEDELPDLVDALEPRWTDELRRFAAESVLPSRSEGPTPFDPGDRSLLDDCFQLHLPAAFAGGTGAYRESQHRVAREVADCLGEKREAEAQLLLVHAPTGTGKTLAYLLPLMLWAKRHGLRAAVATYTRALQEQAMEREVPRALGALRRAGVAGDMRVAMLKGRENYLCWRALKLAAPEPSAGADEWLAWTQLALFATSDVDGDLNRFPQRPPLALDSERSYHGALGDLVRASRAQTSCCRQSDDKRTCAAEVARERAMRSHVVITNHSFALARQDLFCHLVFDECEHLHDQAHGAWSHAFPLRHATRLCEQLYSDGRLRARSWLVRWNKKLVPGTAAHSSLRAAIEHTDELRLATSALMRELEEFITWRRDLERSRDVRDEHSLLREYTADPRGEDLIRVRVGWQKVGNRLDAALSELVEQTEALKLRGTARLRRGLDLVRADLGELLEALTAWIPLSDGKPRFSPQTFHDVEESSSGELVLVARVLLPDEYLGRFYYPQLQTGILLSATTWLRGGFEAQSSYLGLARAQNPAENEERPPCPLSTMRAPEVFDYSRVVALLPRDVPHPSKDKGAYVRHLRDFLCELGERTRGRILVLLTNSEDTKRLGAELEGFFRARRIPLYYQGMPGVAKEELGELFRRRTDSILLGVDTFWYGADFPGETLEYLVIARLPYGVPDRYHYAQCAALGVAEQRRRIYLPRALAKFRQGFGRLMRSKADRGCVFLMDPRVSDPRHRMFLDELPLSRDFRPDPSGARLVRGDTQHCLREALAHMGMLADTERRGLGLPARDSDAPRAPKTPTLPAPPPVLDVELDDLPY